MLINKNIDEWKTIIEATDISHKMDLNFAALIATVTALISPWWFVEFIIPPLG